MHYGDRGPSTLRWGPEAAHMASLSDSLCSKPPPDNHVPTGRRQSLAQTGRNPKEVGMHVFFHLSPLQGEALCPKSHGAECAALLHGAHWRSLKQADTV